MMLGAQESSVLARFCELVVPGSSAIDPMSYADQLLAGATPADDDRIHAAIGLVGQHLENVARIADTADFQLLRQLAVEAFYGDYSPPDHTGPTGREVIGYAPPPTRWLHKDWTFLGLPEWQRGAGPRREGNMRDAERPERHLQDIDRREGRTQDIERREARPRNMRHESAEVVVVGSGAGGGLIAAELGRRGHDVLLLEAGGYHPAEDRVRFELAARHQLWWPQRLGVRVRADWTASVHSVNAGFAAFGTFLEPVRSYTDHTCNRCGACTTGCPTGAGRDTLNTFLAPVLAQDELRLQTHRTVTEVILDTSRTPRVRGVRYRNPDGTAGVVSAPVVVLAAGSLGTPQILLRSNDYMALDTPRTRQVGTTLGLHPARLVYGLFDEPQNCHLAYPITAHCLAHQQDFVVEGTTVQEPVSFAAGMVDVPGRPLWGADLAFSAEVLHAAGAKRVVWSGLSTSRVQGTARMGADPARSVVDDRGRAHGVDGLYVGDGSVVPASLSVNPSLTIMALAAMIAENLGSEL